MRLTVRQLKRLVAEARDHVGLDELMTTWEDLYLNSVQNRRQGDIPGLTPGAVSLDELVSWLNASEEAVRKAISRSPLVVDKSGNVIEKGISTPPPGTIKR
jgi:hypothetical protein